VNEERRFTIEEAKAELDDLRERLPRLREARRTLIRSTERITEAVAADGGGTEGRDWFDAQRALRGDIMNLADRGILLRDPEAGLVDFPAERDGQRVFLCWRLGEETIAFYHGETTGFTGRRPL
jgi:hypothetical protein